VIPRRVKINLVAFALLFLLLCSWAVRNVVHLDVLERPYRIAADFDSAPGLRANVEVTYLGVRVGTIRSLDLRDEVVRVEMAIDRGTDLPEGLTAAIRRKSAVGEPYVALEPPEGYEAGGPYVDHGAREVIPLERTSVPLSYGDLFSSLDDLVDAVPAVELGSVLDELATALDGRGPALRQLFESGEDLTTTLAERSEVFDQLAGELTRLTAVVAAERDDVGRSFDNLAALAGTLAATSDDLDRLLDDAPAFALQVETLLRASLDDLGCTFAGIGGLFEAIGDEEQIEQLLRVLDRAREADEAFNIAVIEAGDAGADGPYLTGSFGLVADDAPPAYDPRPELPDPPPLPRCAEQRRLAEGDAGASPLAVDARTGEHDEAAHEVAVSRRPPAAVPDVPASSDKGVADQRFPLPLAVGLAGLVLLAVLVMANRTRSSPPPAAAGAPASDEDALGAPGAPTPTSEDQP
jgi:phospholipid/cholesterol/gamma-HCH transport system substrate-binding protein